MKTKRFLKTAVALTLAVVLTCLNPLQTFASGGEKEYLSDVYVCVSDSADSAKQYLTDNGYTVLDNNLNEGTGSIVWNSYSVYLGYKTTTNPEEAITDLAIMDMNGDYSYADYEEVLKQKKTQITEMVQSLQTAIGEYRANYQAGLPAATAVHTLLNNLSEDDTGKLLGDFLLDADENQLITFFMQANSSAVSLTYEQLYLACDTEVEKNGAMKMAENGSWVEENGDYYDAASALLDVVPTLQKVLDGYTGRQVSIGDQTVAIGDMTEEQREQFYEKDTYENYLNSLGDTDKADFLKGGAYYELLCAETFSDTEETLYDLFDQDVSGLTPESLYPLVATMTPGQRALAPYVGLEVALFSGYSEDSQNKTNEQIQSVTNGATVSVYAGVDRSMFDPQGIAMTKQADNWAMASGDNSWYYGNLSGNTDRQLLITILALAGTTAVLFSTAAIILASAGIASISNSILVSVPLVWGIITGSKAAAEAIAIGAECGTLIPGYFGIGFSAAGFVCLAALLIVSVVYLGMNVYNYFHPEYTEIPRMMVNNVQRDDGNKYLYYNAVRQTVLVKGSEAVKTDENGQTVPEYGYYADLNGWSGKQWNALFTTKSLDAGKPILASSLKVTTHFYLDSNDECRLHLFNNDTSYNVNEHAYWDDKEGVFVAFKRDEGYNPAATGSTFGMVSMILLAAGCAIGGIGVGSVVTYGLCRKKKKVTA